MRQKRAAFLQIRFLVGTPRKLGPASERRTQAANDWNAVCFVHGFPFTMRDASFPTGATVFGLTPYPVCLPPADPVFRESPSPLLALHLHRSCGLTWTSLAALKHSPDYLRGIGNGQRTFQGGATNLSRNPQAVFIRTLVIARARTEKARGNPRNTYPVPFFSRQAECTLHWRNRTLPGIAHSQRAGAHSKGVRG